MSELHTGNATAGMLEEALDRIQEQHPMLASLRSKAAAAFRAQGLPSKKHEEYRYIPFDRFYNSADSTLNGADAPAWEMEGAKITFANGNVQSIHVPEGSVAEGTLIVSLRDAIESKNVQALSHLGTAANSEADPFIALNTALFQDGIFIYLPKGSVQSQAIHLILESTSDAAEWEQPRILVVAEAQAEARLVQWTCGSVQDRPKFMNVVAELFAAEAAQVDYLQIADAPQLAVVQHTEMQVHRKGNVRHLAFSLEGRLIRNTLQLILCDAHCEGHLYGFYHPRGAQLFDSHTLVDHRMPHCESNELYKGVIADKATAVFNGKVYVRPDAQKTNAYQSNKNILMSEEATVNTKPQLEIYADDVKCSHGSSTGVIDPEQLFYLRSRGIRTEKAQSLLLQAYAGEILDFVKDLPLREQLRERLLERFQS